MQKYDGLYQYYKDAIKNPEAVTGLKVVGTDWSGKVPELVRFPNLQAINMQAHSIKWTSEEMGFFKACKNLREIILLANRSNREPIDSKLAEISQLEKLTIRELDTRIIPTEILKLPNLKSLTLLEVKAETVEDMLARLAPSSRLEHLTLELNHQSIFEDNFLAGIGQLSSLKSLRIQGSPYLPPEIMELSFLESLSVQRGPVPDWIWTLKQLKSLELIHNYLEKASEKLGEFRQLERLNFYLNSLKEIPDSICELTQLKHLNLSYNHLASLPERIGDLQNLESLELHTTMLTGLPDSFAQLKNLNPKINLSQTKMSAFPEVLCKLNHLECIDFSIHGINSLPDSILQLENLKILDLRKCKFKEFPSVLFKMKSLEELTLTQNPITRGGGKVLKKHMNKTFFGPANSAFSPKQKSRLMTLLMEETEAIKQQIPFEELLTFVDNGSQVTREKALQCISELHPSPFTSASIQKVLVLGKMKGYSSAAIKKAVKAAGLEQVKKLEAEPDMVVIGENPGPVFREVLEKGVVFGTMGQLVEWLAE